MKPKAINTIDSVFPTCTDGILPAWKDIPDEFKDSSNKWCRLFSRWCFLGLPKETEFKPKAGIDLQLALRHLKYCMKSWEPKHEHKEAGCAYLMSQWFEDIKIPTENKQQHTYE